MFFKTNKACLKYKGDFIFTKGIIFAPSYNAKYYYRVKQYFIKDSFLKTKRQTLLNRRVCLFVVSEIVQFYQNGKSSVEFSSGCAGGNGAGCDSVADAGCGLIGAAAAGAPAITAVASTR